MSAKHHRKPHPTEPYVHTYGHGRALVRTLIKADPARSFDREVVLGRLRDPETGKLTPGIPSTRAIKRVSGSRKRVR